MTGVAGVAGVARGALVLPVALLLSIGCGLVSTPIGRVLRQPHKYQGNEITLSGRVEATRWMPDVAAIGFRLTDGRDSLLVLTLEPPPPEGERIRLRGHFIRRFPLGAEERPVLLYRTGANGGRVSSTVDPR